MEKELITTLEPYSDLDTSFIRSKLDTEQHSGFKRVFICIAAAIIVPVIPSRRAPHRALEDRMPYAQAFALVMITTAIATIFDYRKKIKSLRRDLESEQKVVVHVQITAKHKSFSPKEKFAIVHAPIPEPFKRHTPQKNKLHPWEIVVSELEYDQLKIGDIVLYEYANDSRLLLGCKLPI